MKRQILTYKKPGKVLIYFYLLLGLFVALLGYIRFAPINPDVWHVDPMVVQKSKKPNQFLMRPNDGDISGKVYGVPADELAELINKVATRKGRVLKGSLTKGWATFVYRSKILGFPDVVSIRVVDEGATSRLAIYGRSKFGYFELGVNRDRIQSWIAEIGS